MGAEIHSSVIFNQGQILFGSKDGYFYCLKTSSKKPEKITAVFEIDSKVVNVNGVENIVDTKPFVKDSRTFISPRHLVEAFSGNVLWDSEKKMVVCSMFSSDCTEHEIKLWIGKSEAEVDGRLIEIENGNSEISPLIVEDRTYVPLRFISEAFGFEVVWHDVYKRISVIKE